MKNVMLLLCLGASMFAQGRIPSGSAIEVRLIDTIDSSKASEGQVFAASVAEDVMVNGGVAIPRGSSASVKLVNLDSSGKFTGRTQLGVVLTNLRVNDRDVAVETGQVTRVSGSQGKKTAVRTGIGAGVGAALGAIFGGGKGAAIGAGAGGAAGAGSQVFTGGKKVQIPSETVLTFVLTNEARVGRN